MGGRERGKKGVEMAGMECKGFPVRRTAVAPAGPLRGSGAQPQRGKGAEPLKDVVFDLKL